MLKANKAKARPSGVLSTLPAVSPVHDKPSRYCVQIDGLPATMWS